MPLKFSEPSVEQYLRSWRIPTFAVDGDESRVVFSSNIDGRVNLWAFDVNTRFPYPLTTIGQACGKVIADPKGRYLLASFDEDGDENWQIYALPPEGGELVPLRPGRDRGEQFFLHSVASDGRHVYYTTSAGNRTYLNVCRHDLKTGAEHILHEGVGVPTSLSAVAPEDDAFITVETYSDTVAHMYLHRDGERIALTWGDASHAATGAQFLHRDAAYFLTDEGEDVHYLARYDAVRGELTRVAKLDGASMTQLFIHRQSKSVYVVAMDGVVDRLCRYDIDEGRLEAIDAPYDVVYDIYVGKSGTLYVIGCNADVPTNISLRCPAGVWQPLTDNRVPGVPKDTLRSAETIRYPSYDGLQIEALLFHPEKCKANGYTVFWVHTGPQAVERKFYRGIFQALLAAGYTVFAPNFRGSTGYGSRFMKMVEGDWGGGPRLDNVAGVQWLLERGIARQDKTFLIGAGYGGYMALLLHGRHPHYWRACVDIFGPSDLFAHVESVPEHWKPLMEQHIGNPERDKLKLAQDSPMTYVHNMIKPMLIIQGANDPRVVQAGTDELVAALRQQGTDVDYMVLPDEGHGFSRGENERLVYSRLLQFLAKHR